MKIRKILTFVLAFALAFSAVFALGACKKKEDTEDEPDAPAAEDVTADSEANLPPVRGDANPLTGISGYDTGKLTEKPVAIVVENHPQARPQWGMSTPDILMEYEVEGGISRMLWLYANADLIPEKVGPVRSARHDVVELARGLSAVFIHAGGSTEADKLLASYAGVLSEIDGLKNEKSFYRDKTRSVSLEHTLVLDGNKVKNQIASEKDTALPEEYRNLFRFEGEDAPRTLEGGESASLHFEYSDNYAYDFKWNAETGKYDRYLNGKLSVDDQGVTCDYVNVFLLYTEMQSRNDSQGHQDLLLEKGGKGLYFCGGRYEEITWEKGEGADPLKLLTADGETLTLNPGNSYIGFVRSTQEGKTAY